MTDEQKSLRTLALDSVPTDLREHLLAWASENGITTPNDSFWPLAAAMANAMRAASAAGQHAQAVEVATSTIPDMLYKNVTSAGADLKAVLEAGIKAKADEAGVNLTNVILAASGHGADALKKAAAGLDMMASARAEGFVEQWKAAVSVAVEKQATTALRRSIARSWGAVAGALLVMTLLGAGIMLGGLVLEHKVIATRGITMHGTGVDGVLVIRRHMLWEKNDCPADAACLVTPEGP